MRALPGVLTAAAGEAVRAGVGCPGEAPPILAPSAAASARTCAATGVPASAPAQPQHTSSPFPHAVSPPPCCACKAAQDVTDRALRCVARRTWLSEMAMSAAEAHTMRRWAAERLELQARGPPAALLRLLTWTRPGACAWRGGRRGCRSGGSWSWARSSLLLGGRLLLHVVQQLLRELLVPAQDVVHLHSSHIPWACATHLLPLPSTALPLSDCCQPGIPLSYASLTAMLHLCSLDALTRAGHGMSK